MREEESLQRAFDQFNALVQQEIARIEAGNSGSEDKQRAIKLRLVGIRDAALDLKVIFVKLDDEDDAYIIFETLNTRGKDLSLTDLVKNHVTKHLKAASASIDQAKIKWEQILETIEGSSRDLETDTFIHHFWLSRYDYLPAKSLFKELKQRVRKAECGKFLSALLSDSAVYRSIHDIPYGKWSKNERGIAESLHALQLFRVQQQTPCVLSLVRAFKAGRIKKKHLEQALVAIEKFHFLFTAVTSQRSSGGISGMYASLGRRMFEAETTDSALEVISELKQKLRDRIPSIAEVKALFPEIVHTDRISKQRGLVKYILSTFDKEKRSGGVTDYEKMTIEHLLSQSEIGNEGITETIVGQLGNLVLVSQDLNERLANKSFAEKKKLLKAANIPLPKMVFEANDWTPTEIKARTESMAVDAYKKLWKI
jgi:hypothetical protein